MSVLLAPQFKRSFAARANAALTGTKVLDTREVILPKESVIHYVPESSTEKGFRGSHSLIAKWPFPVRVHFLEEHHFTHGRFRKAPFSIAKFKKEYHASQKRMRKSRDLDRSIDIAKDLLVVDYTPLTRSVQYSATKTVYIDYWRNLAEETVRTANLIGDKRPQFIQLNLPDAWAIEADFKACLKEIGNSYLNRFRNGNLLWFLEIYRYLNNEVSLLDEFMADDFFFVITAGLKSVFIPLSTMADIRDNGNVGAKQFHDLVELMMTYRTTADTEALKDVEPAKDEAGVPPAVLARLDTLMEAGKLTLPERKRLIAIAQATPNLPNPFGGGSIGEYSKVTVEDLILPKELPTEVNENNVPASAKESTVTNQRYGYVEELLFKDTLNCLTGLEKGGVFVKDVKIDTVSDALESVQLVTLTLTPVEGKETTFTFEVPVVNPDGTFTIGGVRYTMDPMKTDIPLRKIKPTMAAITSYVDKIFISRSGLVKHDYGKWLLRTISAIGLDPKDRRVSGLMYMNQSLPKTDLPRDYTALMTSLRRFKSGSFIFDFDYNARKETYGADVVQQLESKGSVVCGSHNNVPMLMSESGELRSGDTDHGNILEALGGSFRKRPRDVALFKSMNRELPVVLFLGYFVGLEKLLKQTKVKHRTMPVNERPILANDEIAYTFKDERLILTLDTVEKGLVWSGLLDIDKALSMYNLGDFNRRSGWVDIVKLFNANVGHIREWEIRNELFLDPITLEILEEMGEPDNLVDLYLRCVELIKNDNAPDENDPKFQRMRGMERLPGTIYKAMYDAIRTQRSSPNPKVEPISIPPTEIMERIHKDSSVQLVSEINPVHSLKETEALTLAGEGGRSARTLVKRHRAFHDNDVGILSEHTPDSSKVGIRGFMPPNAKLENMRGKIGTFEHGTDSSTSALSTSGLLLPDIDRDDG